MFKNWFDRNKSVEAVEGLKIDMHSHLLPGIDDGAPDTEASIALIKSLQALGFRKLITTPHIMSDLYRNSPEIIVTLLEHIQALIKQEKIDIQIDAAAEYYLDEHLMAKVLAGEKLLSFGNKYVLFETNFLNAPLNMNEFVFQLSIQGYKPVLAHPERYIYFYKRFDLMENLLNRGVYFQLNINSLSGYYSKEALYMAKELIKRRWVHFLGTDCHHEQHVEILRKVMQGKYYQKALALPLLNNTL